MNEETSTQEAEFNAYAAEYRELLNQSVRASGESWEYFANYKAQYVRAVLGDGFAGTLVDYGCGVGLVTECLVKTLPQARVFGYDPSPASLHMANEQLRGRAQLKADRADLPEKLDAVVLSNVMHHVLPSDRQALIAWIGERLSPSGRLLIFEHNPVNPVTRAAVCNCPFDRDAILLPPREVIGYNRQARLRVLRHDYIVFFPRLLKWLRPAEKLLRRCPLGAQFAVLSTPESSPQSSAAKS